MPFVVQNVTKISHNYTLRVKKIIKNDRFLFRFCQKFYMVSQSIDRQPQNKKNKEKLLHQCTCKFKNQKQIKQIRQAHKPFPSSHFYVVQTKLQKKYNPVKMQLDEKVSCRDILHRFGQYDADRLQLEVFPRALQPYDWFAFRPQ